MTSESPSNSPTFSIYSLPFSYFKPSIFPFPQLSKRFLGTLGKQGDTQKSNIVAKQGMTTNLFLRLMAFVLTLAAAILMGVNNQTKVVSLQTISTSLPALNIPVQARWRHLSALVYSFVTDVIASSYAAISFLLLIASRDRKKGLGLMLTIFDLVMVALLLSSCGAAGAVGLLAYTGNSHVRWNKVCNIFDKFCRQGAVSIAFSLLGSLAFLLHIVFAVLSLHNRSNSESNLFI